MSRPGPGPDTHPWESAMSSEFDRRVRDLRETPLTFDTVRGAATGIRRRRRALAAGSLLAAAAVAVAVPLTVGAGADPAPGPDREPSVAARTSAPTPAPTPPGNPAGVAYVADGSFHALDGRVSALPHDTYENAAALGDDVVTFRRDARGAGLVEVLADGEVAETYEADNAFVTSATGGLVAFLTRDGALQTLWDGGARTLAEGYDPAVTSVAAAAGTDCDDRCRVFVNTSDRVGSRPLVVDQAGEVSAALPDAQAVTAVSADGSLVAAITDSTDQGSCSAVWDADAEREVAGSCDYVFEDLSPDGRHIEASHPYQDGFGSAWVAILDLELGEVVRYERSGAAITGRGWSDDDTVGLMDYADGRWRMVTLGTDGATATVLGPRRGSDYEPAFLLVE